MLLAKVAAKSYNVKFNTLNGLLIGNQTVIRVSQERQNWKDLPDFVQFDIVTSSFVNS